MPKSIIKVVVKVKEINWPILKENCVLSAYRAHHGKFVDLSIASLLLLSACSRRKVNYQKIAQVKGLIQMYAI